MIEVYDIVDAASSFLKGALVLHREMKVHHRFKVYKKFRYSLYYINIKGEKTLVSCFEEVRNVPSDNINEEWKETDRLYLRELVKWIASSKFRGLIDYEFQQVSDSNNKGGTGTVSTGNTGAVS